MSVAVILSGLPASGKTTLGLRLAQLLGWPHLDKDDFLEALFDSHTVTRREDRNLLSRQSDVAFRLNAILHRRVVLISHWRPNVPDEPGGTPTDWLSDHFDLLIEVHCPCGPDVAAQNFETRKRHASHLDALQTPDALRQRMHSLAPGYPLGIGTTIDSSCGGPDQIAATIRAMVG
ncbi:MAG: AAA family ATPase [Pelagimonas sp.]